MSLSAKLQKLRPNGPPAVPVQSQPPNVESILVTPSLAREWLEQANTNNRVLRESIWMKYACDMLDSKWTVNGSTIVFGRDGQLLDGQHRLKACAESGVAVVFLVVRAVDPDTWDTIDSGFKRTVSDGLGRNGIQNSSAIAAAAKLLWAYETGGGSEAVKVILHGGSRTLAIGRHQEYLYAQSRQDELGESVKQVYGLRLLSPSVAAFCHCVFARQNKVLADRFFEELKTGTGLTPDNPVYLLRERLQGEKQSKKTLRKVHLMALIFRAWINYRSGQPMRVLRWRPDGPAPEAFPRIELPVGKK